MSLELKKLQQFSGRSGPLLLIILDGVGIGKRDESDGVFLAHTPCLDQLFKSELFTTLKAHGTSVGMPSDEDMGNSEVGHNALGAGRIFAQGAKLVNEAIQSGRIFQTPLWRQLVDRVKKETKLFISSVCFPMVMFTPILISFVFSSSASPGKALRKSAFMRFWMGGMFMKNPP